MIEPLDITTEYHRSRAEHFLEPHNHNSTDDIMMENMFRAAVLIGMKYGLLCVADAANEAKISKV